jgi:hypothetical protein
MMYLFSLILAFSATVPDVALPPASMQSSLKGEGTKSEVSVTSELAPSPFGRGLG